ncbi:MAG: RNA polymerase sigma factor [Kofleriaceae bacterium]
MDHAQELTLIEQARSGPHAQRTRAFETLIEELRRPLFALCLHLTGSRADAEDALQDTLLAIHDGLPGFRGDARLFTWAYRIATRIAFRIKARRRRADSLDHDPMDATVADPAARSQARELARAMDSLSADHRLVLSLFAIDGLSHREIADILGVPEGTVWSRLHAARKKVAAVFSD